MIPHYTNRRLRYANRELFVALASCGFFFGTTLAQAPATLSPPARMVLGVDDAVVWALQHNPEIMASRQQHGISAAGVVIAETYPFNPFWEAKVRAATGPESAGITNKVANEHLVLLELEIHGQGKYRRQSAYAALSRTDWEIAALETNLAIRVIRAFDSVLYREEKLRLMQESVRLNQQVAERLKELVSQGLASRADLIVGRTEVDDTFSFLGPGRLFHSTAWAELRRQLGALDEPLEVRGTLDLKHVTWNGPMLVAMAMEKRADLHARQMAVREAEARLQLQRADRCGNPTAGPAYEYDPSRISLIGAQFSLPLPVFNRHRGEIEQRDAERVRAVLDLRQTEVSIRQDVMAAIARLQGAYAFVNTYQNRIVPNLQSSLKEVEELLRQGEKGVDFLRVIDVRRKLLKARDGYYDALWEVKQAEADLAAAVGDPSLTSCPPVPEQTPLQEAIIEQQQPQKSAP